MSALSAYEVRVSRTVKDLVAGAGFSFADTGEPTLKGIPDKWQLSTVKWAKTRI